MAASTPQTIMLDRREHYLLDEGNVATGSTVYPGMLVIWSSGEIIPNGAAADVDAPKMFAIENDKFGGDLDTAYAADTWCYFVYPQQGARIYAYIETGGNVAKGAALESNGAGYLQAASTGRIVAFADEAVNNSGGGSGPAGSARIRVRVA